LERNLLNNPSDVHLDIESPLRNPEHKELLDRIDPTVAIYKFNIKSACKKVAVGAQRPEGNGK
jgi:methyl coenzyme M reductase beta subunit